MLTSRIEQLKKQFFTHVPAVCLEGALSKTHVFKETEGEPMIVRRAKAFKRHCETKTITIQPGVGFPGMMFSGKGAFGVSRISKAVGSRTIPWSRRDVPRRTLHGGPMRSNPSAP